jgi:hypothetical protein
MFEGLTKSVRGFLGLLPTRQDLLRQLNEARWAVVRAEALIKEGRATERQLSDANASLNLSIARLRQICTEYADYRFASEDRFRAISELETSRANATVRKMAALARAGYKPQP